VRAAPLDAPRDPNRNPFSLGNDFFGRNVVLAARIANAAQGGEILVSSVFKELTERIGDAHFVAARDLELKGIAGTRRVYGVAWQEETGCQSVKQGPDCRAPPWRSFFARTMLRRPRRTEARE